MNKRGQLTIFIIIGFLILAVAGIGIFLYGQDAKEEFEVAEVPVVEKLPKEFEPVQTYTEDCIQDVARKGLLLLGQQGGYIYPDLVGEFSDVDQTDYDGILLGGLKIPYWLHNDAPNDARQYSMVALKPDLKFSSQNSEMSVESQLARYLEEKLPECLDEYSALKEEMGFVIKEGDFEAITTITPIGVNILIAHPLEISHGSSDTAIKDFFVQIPLKLQQMYAVAEEIFEMEKNTTFLENQGLELISLYGSANVNALPPTYSLSLEKFNTISWTKSAVKEKFKNILSANVPVIRTYGSDNFVTYDYPDSKLSETYQGIYDKFIIPVPQAQGLNVNFDYFHWDPYFDLNTGEKISPKTFTVKNSYFDFTMQSYKYQYDVSYPVLITIYDEDALSGNGFGFTFALEANIRDNNAVDLESVAFPPIGGFAEPMVCDEDKFDAGELELKMVDSGTKMPLSGVEVTFTIPGFDNCLMGATSVSGVHKSKYPAVYGGVIRLDREGYLGIQIPIDTYLFKGGKKARLYPAGEPIEMHKKEKIKVNVKKVNMGKCIDYGEGTYVYSDDGTYDGTYDYYEGTECYVNSLFVDNDPSFSYTSKFLGGDHNWYFTNTPVDLLETETATITLKRVGDLEEGLFNDDFLTYGSVKGEVEVEGEEVVVSEIELVPGIYSVTGTIKLDEGFLIPKEKRCDDNTCFNLDATWIENSISGQVLWDEKANYLKIKPEQVYGAEEVTFYILGYNILDVPEEEHKRVIEDLQVLGDIVEMSQTPKMWLALKPKFS